MSGGLERRRLAELPSTLNARVELWHAEESAGGVWYRIKMSRSFIAVELRLSGVNAIEAVPLSLDLAPLLGGGLTPLDSSNYEVRFARHVEYSDGDARECAVLHPIINPSTALYRNTLAIGQMSGSTTCAYDIFLWVPGSTGDCAVTVKGGSVAIDGHGGAVQADAEATCSLNASSTVPALPGPPSPSPLTRPSA